MNYKKNFINEITEGIGFSKLPVIDYDISSYILKEVDKQVKERFKKFCPDYHKYLDNDSIIASYSNIESNLWPKLFTHEQRTLNKNAASLFGDYFKNYLCNLLGKDIIFGDYLGLGYPVFSIRVVRPNSITDIGPLHADQWFIDIGAQPFTKSIKNYELFKLWLPIQSDPKLCNLLVIPNSHKKKNIYNYKIIRSDSGVKAAITTNIDHNQLVMIDNSPGSPLIFNMSLIHGGSINKSKKCRVSLEFQFYASK